MQVLITFFPFILLFVIYGAVCILNAAYIKLSGRILQQTFTSWKHSFIFSLAATLLTVMGKMVIFGVGVSIPPGLEIIIVFILQLVLGGWYFGARGVSKLGQPLGWSGGARLSALAFLLLVLTGVLVNGVYQII